MDFKMLLVVHLEIYMPATASKKPTNWTRWLIRNQIPDPQPLGHCLCSFWSGAGPQDGLGQEGQFQKCAKSELSKIK